MNMIYHTRWFALCSRTLLLAGLMAGAIVPEVFAQIGERKPMYWRQFVPGSATTRAMFLSRSPQFVMYWDGMVIYRDDKADMPYRQVQLSRDEFIILIGRIEEEYRLTVVMPSRLKDEEPYIKSVQKRVSGHNNDSVVIWLGIHKPPSLYRYSVELLEARSGNIQLGPAWDALYRYSQYVSTFQHPRAKPLVPDRIEIAVQPLPSYLSVAADSAVVWSLTDVALREIQGARKRGFRTLTGDDARLAYKLLSENSIVSDGDKTYLVWARPLLVPDKN